MTEPSRHHISQIFWDENTRSTNDPGFRPLDNLSNERPDWSEYWPIRKFLLQEYLQENVYYGYFSPKFHQKTGLTSADVYKFMDSATEDVVTFSPFMDQSSFAINLFEQAAANHRNIYPTLKQAVNFAMPGINIDELIMTSRTSIFCNFFAAKKDFWIRWLYECEKFFEHCENDQTELAKKLNASVNHSGGQNPAKVFLIERVASLILSTSHRWSVKNYDTMALPMASSRISPFKAELVALDGLKRLYLQTKNNDVLDIFSHLRSELLSKANQLNALARNPAA